MTPRREQKNVQDDFQIQSITSRGPVPHLANPKPCLPHINNLLITTIQQLLAESHLNVVIPGLYSTQQLQENDSNIMGTTILPSFLEFTGTHTDISRSTLKWPIQELPRQKSCKIWKKLVCK
jgi:hypothetical protein